MPVLPLLLLCALLALPGCDRSDVVALVMGKPGNALEIEDALASDMPKLLQACARLREAAAPPPGSGADPPGALNRLMRVVKDAQEHMDDVSDGLEELLRAQDAEIETLYALRREDRIATEVLEARIRTIRNQRALLSQALAVAVEHVEAAQRHLRPTAYEADKSHRKLLKALDALEEEAEAARLSLSLL